MKIKFNRIKVYEDRIKAIDKKIMLLNQMIK